MKKIVVNDTNVFIDLFNVGLLEGFFSLPWEVHTTEFVMLELTREGQHDSVSQYKDNGLLQDQRFVNRLHGVVLCQEKQLYATDRRPQAS